MNPELAWFRDARYGLFIHYGLYSLLGRGEWVWNKEQIPAEEYRELAGHFRAEAFDADAMAAAAVRWGMKYAVLTTKHHEGFCLYDSRLTDFTAPRTACGRDLVAEFVAACRRHGLRVGLYHSLNDWNATPGAVEALEQPETAYAPFIDFVHGQIREILTNYGPIDILWYDGWWPFDGRGWQAERLNAMARSLQPDILLNGRCGIPGDFSTPEQHMGASEGPWEACMTLNDHWGFHVGDTQWKAPRDVVDLLRRAAAGAGNLLLNIGPRGDGTIPAASMAILDHVGEWLRINGESIYGSERFDFDSLQRGQSRGDWVLNGGLTARGNAFYLHVTAWPGSELTLSGVETPVREVTRLDSGETFPFREKNGRVTVWGLPEIVHDDMPVVLRFHTQGKPCIYRSGGLRDPRVPHCRYDPVAPDIVY